MTTTESTTTKNTTSETKYRRPRPKFIGMRDGAFYREWVYDILETTRGDGYELGAWHQYDKKPPRGTVTAWDLRIGDYAYIDLERQGDTWAATNLWVVAVQCTTCRGYDVDPGMISREEGPVFFVGHDKDELRVGRRCRCAEQWRRAKKGGAR